MMDLGQISRLVGKTVRAYSFGSQGAALRRRDLKRILGITDDQLLDALGGGERGLSVLLGSPHGTAEVADIDVPFYFVDLSFMMELDLFCTAEAARRGLPEPAPWEIATIGRTTGPVVFDRRLLEEAMVVLLIVKFSSGPSNERFSIGGEDAAGEWDKAIAA